MSSKWEIREEKYGIRVKGEDVDILIDPRALPSDYEDIDFVLLTSREAKDERVLERVLKASAAQLITPVAVRRQLKKKFFVDEVEGIKGLMDDVWVLSYKGELALFLYTEEGPIIIADRMSEEILEKASDYVYGEKPKEILRKGSIGGRSV